MAESSKSGSSNAAQALKRHFDQDRSAHAGHQSNWRNPASSFRSPQNAGQQQVGDQHYSAELMGNLSLDDTVRVNSPGFISGPGGAQGIQPLMHTPGLQPSFSVDEFKNKQGQPGFNGAYQPAYLNNLAAQQSTFENAILGGQSSAPMNMHPVAHQMPGLQNMGPGFGALAHPPPLGAQSGFMPGYMGYNYGVNLPLHNAPFTSIRKESTLESSSSTWSAADDALLVSLRKSGMNWEDVASNFPTQTVSTCSLHYHDLLESQNGMAASRDDVAAAWEASFEEAMDEWMLTQTNLEAVEALEAVENPTVEETQDQPLHSSELARAAQQLVDAVSDNDSEKFRKSNFVDLMRRIAAQEIIVENNSLVEVTTPASGVDTEFGVMSDAAGNATTKDKGKGKAIASPGSFDDAE